MSPQTGGGLRPGALTGFVAASVAIPALLFAGAAGWVLLGVMAAGAFVLVRSDAPFRRDLGAGVLAAVALVTLVVGGCFAMFSAGY